MFFTKLTKSTKSLPSSKRIIQPFSYTPTFFLRHHFLQSVYQLTSPQIKVEFKREQIFFEDGGHVSLDWCNKEQADKGRPIVLIMHGMTGGSETKYIKVLVEKANENQYCSICLNGRGINSQMTSHIPFTGFDFHEIDKVILEIQLLYPENPLYLIGTSLGGNYLMRYLMAHQEKNVNGLVLISPPFDIRHVMDQMNMTYQKFFIKSYLQNTILRHDHMKYWWENGMVDLESLKKSQNMRQFHDRITIKILGFDTANQMFEHFKIKSEEVEKFKTKTLIITAKDDPMVGFESFPHQSIQKNKNVQFMVTDKGGHLCWFEGMIPKRWYPKPAFDFINKLQQQTKAKNLI